MKWPNKKYKIGENHLCRSVFFVTQISQMTQIFSHGIFFIGCHGIYSEVSCCGDYSRIFADATCPVVADTPWDWKMSHRFHRFTQIFLGTFFLSRRFRRWRRFFLMGFFSSDATEFIRRFPAAAITHGFSRMRPVRSLQIPPETGKCPTDFTDLHRFFLGRFFCHADFADDADFFSWDFFHRMPRNLFGDFLLWRLLTDFRRCDLSGRCRYPLRLDKEIHQRFHRKSV